MTNERSVDGATNKLLEDFDHVVRDSESLLRSLAGVTGEKAVALRESVEANLATAKTRLRELKSVAAERAGQYAHEADEYVHQNPWTAIGVAAGIGVLVGIILSSRR